VEGLSHAVQYIEYDILFYINKIFCSSVNWNNVLNVIFSDKISVGDDNFAIPVISVQAEHHIR
jgi:hypothetical protein